MKRKRINKKNAKKIITCHVKSHRVYPEFSDLPSFDDWIAKKFIGEYTTVVYYRKVKQPSNAETWLVDTWNKNSYSGGRQTEQVVYGDFKILEEYERETGYSFSEIQKIMAKSLPLVVKTYNAWRGKTTIEIWLTREQLEKYKKEYSAFCEKWETSKNKEEKETKVISLSLEDDFYILEKENQFNIEDHSQYESEFRRILDKNGKEIFFYFWEKSVDSGSSSELEKVFILEELVYFCQNEYSSKWKTIGFGRYSELFEEKNTDYENPCVVNIV